VALEAGHETPTVSEDENVGTPTEADLDQTTGSPRIVFIDADYNYEDLGGSQPYKEEGPAWELRAVRFPAISEDGRSVLVDETISSIFQQIPNLKIVRRRVLNDAPIEEISILDEGEFGDAKHEGLDAGTPEQAKRTFDKLKSVVRARIRDVNKRLRVEALRPLERCTTDDHDWLARMNNQEDPDPYEPEQIDCPGAKIAHHPKVPTFDVIFEGRTFTVGRADWAIPRPTADGQNDVPLRTSVFGAIDRERGLFVLNMQPTCLGGGDWCYLDSRWHTLPLRQPPQ